MKNAMEKAKAPTNIKTNINLKLSVTLPQSHQCPGIKYGHGNNYLIQFSLDMKSALDAVFESDDSLPDLTEFKW